MVGEPQSDRHVARHSRPFDLDDLRPVLDIDARRPEIVKAVHGLDQTFEIEPDPAPLFVFALLDARWLLGQQLAAGQVLRTQAIGPIRVDVTSQNANVAG